MTGTVDLNPNHLATVEAILAEHVPECEVRAFGSRATWTARDYSDLDLAVVGEGPLDWRTLSRLKEAFEESDLPMRVDVLDWHATSESFREVIERDYVVLWEEAKQPTAIHWTEVTLGDVCTKIGSGATPRGGKAVYLEDGPYALIRSQNVYNAGFARDGLAFISDAHAEALHNVEVLPDDVLLNITGDSVARVCQVDPLVLPARVNQHVAIVRTYPGKLDPGYLRYYLAAPEVQSMLLSWAGSGGTRNALTKRMIETFVVQAPADLAEQRAIAHVLGTLDDKIELNRRMNETLEEMARTLFKSWFVDFEPVRAKMEGRWRRGQSLPGLPAEHYDLFPDRLVDSELGEMPEGWEVKGLGDICHKPQYGYTASASDENVGPKFLRITDINKKAWIDWGEVPYCQITQDDWSKYQLRQGDIVIARMADPGHGCMIEADQEAVFASYLIRFRPVHERYARLLQYWLRSDAYWELVMGRGAGTTRVSLNAKVLSEFPLVLPSTSLSDAFGALVNSLRTHLVANAEESRSLAAQRDALLPRLVSGEVGPGGCSERSRCG